MEGVLGLQNHCCYNLLDEKKIGIVFSCFGKGQGGREKEYRLLSRQTSDFQPYSYNEVNGLFLPLYTSILGLKKCLGDI